MPGKTDRLTTLPLRSSRVRVVPAGTLLAVLLGSVLGSAGAFADSSGPASVTPVDNSGIQIHTTILPAQPSAGSAAPAAGGTNTGAGTGAVRQLSHTDGCGGMMI